jgi:hypothetical protein
MRSARPPDRLHPQVIKVLATTVGGTAADFLNNTLGLGLTGTSLVMAGLLIMVLFFQCRACRYVPWIYWLAACPNPPTAAVSVWARLPPARCSLVTVVGLIIYLTVTRKDVVPPPPPISAQRSTV